MVDGDSPLFSFSNFRNSNSEIQKKRKEEKMSSEDQKAEYVSRAKLSEQAERYDDMAEFMRLVTESGIGKSVRGSIIRELREIIPFHTFSSVFLSFHPFGFHIHSFCFSFPFLPKLLSTFIYVTI